MSGGELRRQGRLYLVDSLDRDPITLVTIAFAVVTGVVTRHSAARALAAGIVWYLGYVVWIGGDFMAGRFVAAPLFAAVLLCAWLAVASREVWLGSIGVLAIVGSTAAHVRLWMNSSVVDPGLKPNGIVDERGIYFKDRSLVLTTRQRLRDPAWPTDNGEPRAIDQPPRRQVTCRVLRSDCASDAIRAALEPGATVGHRAPEHRRV